MRPFVLLLTGPAGAGKTTAAGAWAAAQGAPAAHVSLDRMRLQVRSGFADPQQGWTAETRRQYELARGACATLARRYLRHGFRCAIDDTFFPSWREVGYAGWRTALRGVPHVAVVLLPRLEVIVERNRRRPPQSDHAPLDPPALRAIYGMMLGWAAQARLPVLDTSELSLPQTVQALDAVVRARLTGMR